MMNGVLRENLEAVATTIGANAYDKLDYMMSHQQKMLRRLLRARSREIQKLRTYWIMGVNPQTGEDIKEYYLARPFNTKETIWDDIENDLVADNGEQLKCTPLMMGAVPMYLMSYQARMRDQVEETREMLKEAYLKQGLLTQEDIKNNTQNWKNIEHEIHLQIVEEVGTMIYEKPY